MKVLVTGATGDIGLALLAALPAGWTVGAHGFRRAGRLNGWAQGREAKVFRADLRTKSAAHKLVNDFVRWAEGIDALVQLTGDVRRPIAWEKLDEKDWQADLGVNLLGPFFLAQRAMASMKKGGRVIFTSTASAAHGGGANTLAYGAAKAAVECVAKGLARAGAKKGILVNAVAPGFIRTRFHTDRLRRSPAELEKRAAMTRLGRAGKPEDVAAAILYLLSPGGDYITGEVLPISGGDWL